MTQLLMLRERGIRFIKEYETWFTIGGKFVGMMFVFTCINNNIGYFPALCSMPVTLLLAMVCSIIPSGFIVFITGAVTAAQMMKLSMPIGIVTVMVMLIIYLLFLKFSSRFTLVLLAVPVLMQWHLQFMVPVIAGIIFTPYAFIPAVAGMFIVKFLGCCTAAASLTGTSGSINYEGIITALNTIFSQSLADKDVWMFAVAAAVAIAVGYFVSRISFDYSWYIGLAAAAAAEIVTAFLAAQYLGVSSVYAVPGAVLGLIVGAVIQFFRCVVDYSRKEYLQFEDEDYYYYVKAIPKYLTLSTLPDPEPSDGKKHSVIQEAGKAAGSARDNMKKIVNNRKDSE